MSTSPNLAPLVFVCHRVDDLLRFALHQAQMADMRRPLVVLTADVRPLPPGVAHISPEALEHTGDVLSKHDLLTLLASYVRHTGTEACWYLAPRTLLFEGLAWPEETLADVEVAAVENETTFLVLYAKAGPLQAMAQLSEKDLSIEERADSLELLYQPLGAARMGHTFCTGIQNEGSFEKEPGKQHKKVIWVGKSPFFIEASGKLVTRAITLHFDDDQAKKLPKFYTGPGLWALRAKALLGLAKG